MLTVRPEEEGSGLQSDVLKELEKLHERALKAMKSMAKSLCSSMSLRKVWSDWRICSRVLGVASSCGRHPCVVKVHERHGRW